LDDLDHENHPYASRLGNRLGGLWRMVDVVTAVFAMAAVVIVIIALATMPNISPMTIVAVALVPFGALLIIPWFFLRWGHATRVVCVLISMYIVTGLLFLAANEALSRVS
jgi:hypothetical protein